MFFSYAMIGFLWAAGYAHWRIADRLPPSLEGRDLRVTGVVASLPAAGERSVRFELDVEHAVAVEVNPVAVRLALAVRRELARV